MDTDSQSGDSVSSSYGSQTTHDISNSGSLDEIITESNKPTSLQKGIPSATTAGESWYKIMREITFPFFIAGLGMLGVGLFLDYVLDWQVYNDVPELLVLVTPLLGFDLEISFAARLSSHSNAGVLDIRRERRRICFGNLALDQLRAFVCGVVSVMFALCMNVIKTGSWPLSHTLLLFSATILTAGVVSIVLGSLMICLILTSRKYNINPDNISTQIASSLGNVVTLLMLSTFARVLWNLIESGQEWVTYIIFAVFLLIIIPVCFWYAYKNEYVKPILVTGWLPIITSVVLSTGGGIIMESAEDRFRHLPLFQPIMTGIGANLVSVQASRIATQMKLDWEPKHLPVKLCSAPWSIFTKGVHAVSARVLLLLVIPGHLVFVTIAWTVSLYPAGESYDFLFLATFIVAALILVSILLYLTDLLCRFVWRIGQDPDVNTIPYMLALSDLLGSGILFVVFLLLTLRGEKASVMA